MCLNNDFCSDELYHYGIKGQKWGRRRYQNEDGSLTDSGRAHYGYSGEKDRPTKSKNKKPHSIRQRLIDNYVTNVKDNDIVTVAKRKKLEQNMRYQGVVNNAINTKKQKKLLGKANEMVGAGANKTHYENQANYYEKLAKTYSNKNKRKNLEREARNLRYLAETESKRSKNYNKGGKAALKQAARDGTIGWVDKFNTPYEKVNGKVTTRGRAFIEDAAETAITRAVVTTATDAIFKAMVPDSTELLKRK